MADDVQKDTLTIGFEKTDSGDHTADARAVASNLQAVTMIVETVHQAYAKDKKFLMKARPFKEGSLEVPIDLILFMGAGLLASTPFFRDLLDTLRKYLDLKIRLGGQQFDVRDGNVIVIQDSKVRVDPTLFDMLRPDSDESNALAAAFNEAEKDEDITAVTLRLADSSIPPIRISRHDFARLRTPLNMELLEAPAEVSSRETLTIRSVAFDAELNWNFYWKGNPISARMPSDFMQRVQYNREAFRAGDQLDVDLSRTEIYDAKFRYRVPKKFSIDHVYKHLEGEGEQQTFMQD